MEALIQEEKILEQHINEHEGHRFNPVTFRGDLWDLGHLDPYAFKLNLGNDQHVFVVVLFTCHCFTHKVSKDVRDVIPEEEIYKTSQETRVLNEERYTLSRMFLRQIVKDIQERHITCADEYRNFVTIENIDETGTIQHYGVYFEVLKDKQRKGRMILRIQSAYLIARLTNRYKSAKKVRFNVLVKAIYEGRKIRA